ncbi:MAG: regulatory protein RecX [Clostridia bacterium]
MATITKLTCQTKNPDRVNLFLDGEFCCGISNLLVVQQHLYETKEIDEKDLRTLIFESDKNTAFDYALNYISRYTPTKFQLRKKLFDKDYGAVVVDYVTDKLIDYGYINDAELAKCYAEYNKEIKGKNRIRQDLLAKHVDKSIIDEVLNEVEFDSESIFNLARKHCRNKDLDDQKYVARLVRYLQYRGYQWEEISSCLAQLKVEMRNQD